MQLINFKNQDELFDFAADDFIKKAQEVLKHKKYFDVALLGGSTAQSFFHMLAHKAENIRCLEYTRFFVSDERAVDLSSDASNAGNAWRHLLAPLGLRAKNFFPAFDNSCDAKTAAAKYQTQIKDLLKQDQNNIPVFDLVYLGIGLDGHTASLFPNNNLLRNNLDIVASTDEEIAGFKRITFMPKLINSAKNICIIASGANKASILDKIIKGPLEPFNLPAQFILRAKHTGLMLLTSA